MSEIQQHLLENYKGTCSITNPVDNCVTFIRNEKYLKYLNGIKNVCVLMPHNLIYQMTQIFPDMTNTFIYHVTNPEYEFALYHNEYYKNFIPEPATIGNNCYIHQTAVLNVPGLKVVIGENNERLSFIHTGNTVIGDSVELGPYCVVHRGTLGSTIIRDNCKFSAHNNIGHNCEIGENTVMASGVILNGGVKVGKNCWFGSGSVIKHYVNICDNVVIGMGSVVTSDITKPGIYYGSPAKYIRQKDERWNF